MSKTKYPYQIKSIIHKAKATTRVFGIDAHLFSPPAEVTDGRVATPPLEMHSGFSRFVGTLLQKDADGVKTAKFNLPASEVPYLLMKTNLCIQSVNGNEISKQVVDLLSNILSPDGKYKKEETNNSTAFTVKISAGALKNKTPAEVILANPKDIEKLNNQVEWLKKNLSNPTYKENNEKQIKAIEEAISLYNSGKLVENKTTSSFAIKSDDEKIIYETPCKNCMPKDDNGNYTIYQVRVKYNSSQKLPFIVEIMNCFAPVDTTKGNEIIMSKAINKRTLYMSLSESEWYDCIQSMSEIKKNFEAMTFSEQFKLAMAIDSENRKGTEKAV